MDIYLISSMTLALIPIGPERTHIIEYEKEFDVSKPFMEIIDYNCKINGSSYKGRCESSKLLIGLSSKLPILLNEKEIYIPTNSSKNNKCCWISYNNLKDYYKKDKKAVIVFKNNRILLLDITFSIFENQIYKVNKLLFKLNSIKCPIKT